MFFMAALIDPRQKILCAPRMTVAKALTTIRHALTAINCIINARVNFGDHRQKYTYGHAPHKL